MMSTYWERNFRSHHSVEATKVTDSALDGVGTVDPAITSVKVDESCDAASPLEAQQLGLAVLSDGPRPTCWSDF